MTWPLAVVCMVAIVSTLIYLACTSWYWFDNKGGYPSTEEPKPLPQVDTGPAPGVTRNL